MSNSVAFLLVPLAAAVVGSVLLWLYSRAHRPVEPNFQDRLKAIAPDASSPPAAQPSGIVHLDPPTDQEL